MLPFILVSALTASDNGFVAAFQPNNNINTLNRQGKFAPTQIGLESIHIKASLNKLKNRGILFHDKKKRNQLYSASYDISSTMVRFKENLHIH